jgi:hypothetical protein
MLSGITGRLNSVSEYARQASAQLGRNFGRDVQRIPDQALHCLIRLAWRQNMTGGYQRHGEQSVWVRQIAGTTPLKESRSVA